MEKDTRKAKNLLFCFVVFVRRTKKGQIKQKSPFFFVSMLDEKGLLERVFPLNDKNDKKNWARRRELVLNNNVVFAARKRALECESPWDRARGWLDASAPPPSSRARSSLFFFGRKQREKEREERRQFRWRGSSPIHSLEEGKRKEGCETS